MPSSRGLVATGPGASAPLRADAARNRERVLAVARDAVASGDLTLPLNTLARRAGVGTGTVYRHFPTRAHLAAALAEPGLAGLRDAARRAAAGDPADALARFLRDGLAALARDRVLAEVLGAGGPSQGPAADELLTALRRLLVGARGAGTVRRDVTVDDVLRLLRGVDHAARTGAPDPGRGERYLGLLLVGLRPDRG